METESTPKVKVRDRVKAWPKKWRNALGRSFAACCGKDILKESTKEYTDRVVADMGDGVDRMIFFFLLGEWVNSGECGKVIDLYEAGTCDDLKSPDDIIKVCIGIVNMSFNEEENE